MYTVDESFRGDVTFFMLIRFDGGCIIANSTVEGPDGPEAKLRVFEDRLDVFFRHYRLSEDDDAKGFKTSLGVIGRDSGLRFAVRFQCFAERGVNTLKDGMVARGTGARLCFDFASANDGGSLPAGSIRRQTFLELLTTHWYLLSRNPAAVTDRWTYSMRDYRFSPSYTGREAIRMHHLREGREIVMRMQLDVFGKPGDEYPNERLIVFLMVYPVWQGPTALPTTSCSDIGGESGNRSASFDGAVRGSPAVRCLPDGWVARGLQRPPRRERTSAGPARGRLPQGRRRKRALGSHTGLPPGGKIRKSVAFIAKRTQRPLRPG
ncbi:MAG: hypothetical protein LBG06_11000 [Deltaproteobacteria bacterium]|nr:hypothetical protein [Deltaproteobacteria bacterium]